jgi:hypothetical protein
MLMSSAGLRPEKDCAGEAKQQQLQTRPLVREGASHQQNHDCLKIIKKEGEKFVAGSK